MRAGSISRPPRENPFPLSILPCSRLPAEVLLARLEKTMEEVAEALEEVQPEDILEYHDVQIYRESGLSILVHVVEHFSYHVGQITYYVKAIKDMDMGYYEGEDLG